MPVTVRRLGEDDWAALREVRLRALLDAPESFYTTYQDSVALLEADWRSRLRETGKVTLLAEVDDHAAGMVTGVPAGEAERDPDAAMMLAMWVSPESRGRGVADALTTELLTWSREQSFKRLVLWVYDAAPRAAAFYRRAGFLPTGRTETFNDPDRRLSLMAQTL